jgi:hypothetical protein
MPPRCLNVSAARGTAGFCQTAEDNHLIEQAPPLQPPSQYPDGDARTWARRAAGWIVPVENPERVVYGVLAIGALMAAESGRNEAYPDAIGSALLATGLYWLAHSYANVLGGRLATKAHLTRRKLRHALIEEWAIVRGAAIPMIALLIAWAVGAGRETGINVALWSAIASLLVFELVAGIRSRASAGELAVEAGLGLTMGLAILALKAVLE